MDFYDTYFMIVYLSTCQRPLGVFNQSKLISWIDAPSFGRIFSYTVVFSASHDAVINDLPYNVVLVEFDGMDDLRLVSNVVDAKPDELAIGREVVVVWEMGPNYQLLPRFKLRKTK